MKTYMTLFFAIMCIALTSCSSTKEVTVNATPGTTIIGTDGKFIATVDGTGSAKFKLKKYYTPFLLAKAPNSDKVCPFALDFKKKNNTSDVLWGTAAMVGGFAVAMAGGFDNPAMYCLGLGTMVTGECVAIISAMKGTSLLYDYLEQRTNEDLLFEPLK